MVWSKIINYQCSYCYHYFDIEIRDMGNSYIRVICPDCGCQHDIYLLNNQGNIVDWGGKMFLKMQNFRKFKEKSVEFKDGVNLLSGKNGQGKSTIVQAIQYALFGSGILPYSTTSIQNKGSEQPPFSVILSFDGYTIVRGNEGASMGDVKGHTAVNNAVENLFKMNKETFVVSNCVNQGELSLLTSMRPAERLKFIKKLFQLESLENAVKQIDADRKEIVSEAKFYKAKVEDFKDYLSIELPEKSKEWMQERLKFIENRRKELKELRQKFYTKKTLEEQLDGYIYTPLTITVSEWKEKFKDIDKIRQRKKDYLKFKSSWDKEELENLLQIKGQIETCEGNIVKLKFSLNKYKSFLDIEPYLIDEEKEAVDKYALTHNSSFSSTLICPVCGDEINHCSSCGSNFDIIKSAVSKLKAHEALKYKDLLEKEEAKLKDLKNKFDSERLNELTYLERKAEEFALVDVEEDFRLLDEINNYPSLDEIQYLEQMNALWDKWHKLEDIEFDPSEEEVLENEWEYLIREINKWEKYESLKEEYKSLKEEYIKIDAKARLYKETTKKMKEFVSYMTDKVLPTIQEYTVNFFTLLTNNKFSSIEIDNKFNIFVEGKNMYEILSGGEQNLMNLSLRLGIAKTLKQLHGSKFDVLILDEVTGAFDDERSREVMEQISMLKNFFKIIIVITHKEVDKEFADHIINL